MPMKSIILKPGVNVEKTLSLNEAGVSNSNLIRYKEGLIQKYGGWQKYYPFPVSSTPIRDLHAWQGLRGNKAIGVGSLTNLTVISCGILLDVTPQQFTHDTPPNFSISSGSNSVKVIDPGSSASTFNTVYFNTPVSIGNILLSGAYPITTVIGSSAYTINATTVASTTIASSGVLPTFTTTAGSAVVVVTLSNNGFLSVPGLFYPFTAPTSVGGLTIQGPYIVSSIIDSTQFNITTTTQASSSAGPTTMNGGNAELVYYVTLGPPATAGAYGSGNYGAGLFGLGTPPGAGQGTPITTTDWILDNWGEVLIACPRNGAIYTYSADSSFSNAQVITTGPLFNGGAFVSMPQQILVAWASTQTTGVQDPLIVKWSDSGNYNQWSITAATAAGAFHIPTGSTIMGGLQAPLYALIWTDVDVWTMQYIGQPLVFGFTRTGSGCGLIGPHAADVWSTAAYWMGVNNFYVLGAEGVQVLPCPVWDFVFQQIDTANQTKVRCASNSTFSEISWFFPIVGGTGENSAYVKMHREGDEFEWDFGMLSRSAWIDVTALGNPIASDNNQNILQHEMTADAAGSPINSFFETGWFSISDGNELSFVDWVLPDMKWSTYPGTNTGTIIFTFYAVDFPSDTQRVYGPFNVTQATEFINVRIRGRLMRVRIESNDMGSFWRIGRIRLRWGPSGRR